jgi:hypothetical protein
MTSEAEEFLIGEKAIKPSGPTIFVWKLNRLSTLPRNALCPGESRLQKLGWGADLDVNMAVAHTWGAANIVGTIDALKGILGIFLGREFNEAIHCLTGGPFHHDMNGTSLRGWEQIGTASKERGHLLTSHSVRNLGIMVISNGITERI